MSVNGLLMKLVCVLGCLLSILAPVSGTQVLHLTDSNFQEMVLKSNELFLVEFYAPWCGHCKKLEPEWKRAAQMLDDSGSKVKLVAIDCTTNPKIANKYAIQGFPTIKYFGKNKKRPVDYSGPRESQGIVDLVTQWESSVKTSSSSSSSQKKQSGDSKQKDSSSSKSNVPDVLHLTDANFQKEVLESNDLFIVEFYAPWCGHCKKLEPEYKKAGKSLKNKQSRVKLVAVDCTTNPKISQKYGIQGYPTLKYFGPNKKKPTPYEGAREAIALVEAALRFETTYGPSPEVVELVDENAFHKCAESGKLCLLVILPDILDSGAKGRNDQLRLIKKIAKENKENPAFRYAWSYAGAQPHIEQAFDLGGSGYPAIAAISSKKKMYAKYIRAFDLKALSQFLNGLISGKTSVLPFNELPQTLTVAPWDGKDGKMPSEEL